MKFIKYNLIIILLIVNNCIIIAQQNTNNSGQTMVLNELVNKKNTIHQINSWPLVYEFGENSNILFAEAVEYKSNNPNLNLKGVRFTIKQNNTINNDFTQQYCTTYIDYANYPQIQLVIKQFISAYQNYKNTKQYGSMLYITDIGITFGFHINKNNSISYIIIENNGIKARFNYINNIGHFYSMLDKQFEIASEFLYLPQNANKLKKVKKTYKPANDVNIDNI